MAFSRFKPSPPKLHVRDERSKPRVLYVEDEDINWEIAQHELSDKYELSRAMTAREAFGLISLNTYDLILLDIQLSGSDIDGIKVARLLKGQPVADPPAYSRGVRAEETPIIFVTGYTARYPREELIAAGGAEMIAKPVDFTRLPLVMARVRGRSAPPSP